MFSSLLLSASRSTAIRTGGFKFQMASSPITSANKSALSRLDGIRRTIVTGATSEGDKEVLTFSNITGRSIVLNRPKAHNALTHSMIKSIKKHLTEWKQSDLCDVVMLKSNSSKAFCAGGDVVKVSNDWKEGHKNNAISFFQDEYQVNHMIASYPKPIVALIGGYTMGGGVGLSIHAPFRVATETTVFAMPETKIGFFPDVGATFFLPRLDGQTGTFLGLTGHKLVGRDLLYAGIATHYVPSERIPMLEKRLQEIGSSDYETVNQAIEEFSAQPEDENISYSLAHVRDAIDRCFKFNNMEMIYEALENETEHSEWAKSTLKTLKTMSPSSLKLTLEQIRNGTHNNIKQAFSLELQLAKHRLDSSDMHEGIKELLITKTMNPKWSPATIEEVNIQEIYSTYFETGIEEHVSFVNDINFAEYPHKFTLPSENDIKSLIIGENPQAGSFRPTRKDIIEFFVRETNGKIGVTKKVAWVLNRKTKESNDTFTLKWIN